MKSNLKQLRKIKGVSQKELADIIGVSKAMISMWENNPNEKIPEIRVKQISDYFNIKESVLFDDDLDTDAFEKKEMEEEIKKLEARYTERYQEDLEKVEELVLQNSLLSEEIEEMINEPEKLKQVKRFGRIINSMKNDRVLDRIQPFAKDTLLNSFLSLMEKQNPDKLKMLFIFIEYLMLLEDSTNNLDKVKSSFSEYKDKLYMIDKVMNLEIKGGRNNGTNK